MTLVVTPGGPLDDSLTTLAEFKAYAASLGYDYSSYDDEADIEPALRVATVWVEGFGGATATMSSRWPGKRSTATQRRLWPRSSAVYTDGTPIDSETVPTQVKDAVSEAAWHVLTNGAASLKQVLTPSSTVLKQKIAIDGIETTYQSNITADSVRNARVMLTVVEDLLSGVLVPELTGPLLYMKSIGGPLE